MKCGKIINLLKKEFDSEPVYSDNYIKTKIKIYSNRVYANFQYHKIPKVMNTINEDLELSESDDEFDKFDECQHISDGLH